MHWFKINGEWTKKDGRRDEDILAEEERSKSEAEFSSRRNEARPFRFMEGMKPVEQIRITPNMISVIVWKIVSILFYSLIIIFRRDHCTYGS